MNWIALASVSAVLSAAAAIAQKKTLRGLHALEFSFLVSVAILACSAWVPFTAPAFALTSRALAVLWGKSVLGGVAFLCVMMTLERAPISGALPLMGLTPAVTAVLAQLLIGERLHGGEWIGLALMVAGTWALEMRAGLAGPRALGQALWAPRQRWMLGALLLFAVSSVADKLLVGGMKVPPNVVLFHQHVVYTLVFGIGLALRRTPWAVLGKGVREQWPLLAAIAVLTLGYRFFQLQATRVGPVALVLAVKRTSIVYATLFGGRLFSEERLVPRVAGALLIVAAGFLFLGRE